MSRQCLRDKVLVFNFPLALCNHLSNPNPLSVQALRVLLKAKLSPKRCYHYKEPPVTIHGWQLLVMHRASLVSAAVQASHKRNLPTTHLSRFVRPAVVREKEKETETLYISVYIFPAIISYFLPLLARGQNSTNQTKGENVCLTATMERANVFHRGQLTA